MSNISPNCKTGCGEAAQDNGWCRKCHTKYKKGYFIASGEVNPAILAKIKAKEEKQKIQAIKVAHKNIFKIITPSNLRALEAAAPDMNSAKYCKQLEFWTSDVVCYSRLFLRDYKDCYGCKIHNDSFISLNEKLEKLNETKAISAAETSSREFGHIAEQSGSTTNSSAADERGGVKIQA